VFVMNGSFQIGYNHDEFLYGFSSKMANMNTFLTNGTGNDSPTLINQYT